MAPHNGLVHPKEYDIKDSNVELIGSDLDHRVKYNSATTEPAWTNGQIGQESGFFIWRIENFEVVPWPKERYGEFYDGDSYVVLHSYKMGKEQGEDKLAHDIFFWLGGQTTQDEAGSAAYKTMELDEFLHGAATQHRETQSQPSDEFLSLFRHYRVRSGGVRSGFTHVEPAEPKDILTLLRIFKDPGGGRAIIVHEVEPTWQSLDERDVFVLDKGEKIWVWQGKSCSPMEKAKAAQVVNDMTLAKHVDVEVLSQLESRSKIIVDLLGGKEVQQHTFQAQRPGSFAKRSTKTSDTAHPRKLFRLSDASGQLSFDLIRDGGLISQSDLDGNDIFLYDTGNKLWVWQGLGASEHEKAHWLKVAQHYVRQLQESEESSEAYLTPIARVVESHESLAFLKAIQA